MLSLTAEYALRAALYLGRHTADGPIPADRIAMVLGAPKNYLSKTLNELAKRGIVKGTRGPRGGFTLAIPPNELSVYELVGHFDDLEKSHLCLLGGVACDARHPCVAHARWNRLVDRAVEPLRSTTIGDLLAGAGSGGEHDGGATATGNGGVAAQAAHPEAPVSLPIIRTG
jgi:Rrf2 family protein